MNRLWVRVALALLLVAAVAKGEPASAPNASDAAIRGQAIEPLEAQPTKPPAASSVRLVGRKGEAYAVNPDGTVIAIPKGRIVFRNQASVPMTAPSAPDADTPSGEAPAQDTSAEGEPAPAPNADEQPSTGEGEQKPTSEEPAEAGSTGETPGDVKDAPPPPKRDAQADANTEPAEKKEVDPAQVARIRRLQGLNSWFYSEDGKPLSASDIDRMIQAGEVSKIRAHDIYQQQYDFGAQKDDKDRPSGEKNWLP